MRDTEQIKSSIAVWGSKQWIFVKFSKSSDIASIQTYIHCFYYEWKILWHRPYTEKKMFEKWLFHLLDEIIEYKVFVYKYWALYLEAPGTEKAPAILLRTYAYLFSPHIHVYTSTRKNVTVIFRLKKERIFLWKKFGKN